MARVWESGAVGLRSCSMASGNESKGMLDQWRWISRCGARKSGDDGERGRKGAAVVASNGGLNCTRVVSRERGKACSCKYTRCHARDDGVS